MAKIIIDNEELMTTEITGVFADVATMFGNAIITMIEKNNIESLRAILTGIELAKIYSKENEKIINELMEKNGFLATILFNALCLNKKGE